VRNALPNLGGIDLSPLIVIAVLELLVQPLLAGIETAILTGYWQGIIF
jgi:YggT family protein